MASRMNKQEENGVIRDVIQNWNLVCNLSKNDFKTKFAGSYLGVIWAFIQPVVTVMVYWFVFQIALPSQPVNDVPFVLWLVAGIVPWFFFSDAWNGGTIAFIEYSYLVKKVVFKISILPFVKVSSALFTHVAFIVFTLVIYIVYGYYPDLYALQIVYYSFALFAFTLALSYITSSAMVFFRDLSQIINIILQVGIWITPILWNMETANMSEPIKVILRLNPLYYIVNGYRGCLIYKSCFLDDLGMTAYFWIVTIILYMLGAWMYKRLRVHFADVL